MIRFDEIRRMVKTEFGIDMPLTPKVMERIGLWSAMFRDDAPWLSDSVKSAGIPSAVVSELARLATVEYMAESSDATIDGWLAPVTGNIRNTLEYGLAKGGVVYKPIPSDDGITVQVIHAGDFYPIDYDGDSVSACVFVEQMERGQTTLTRVEAHLLDNDGLHIENRAYSSKQKGRLGTRISLWDVDEWADIATDAFYPGMDRLPFGYFRYPMADTEDAGPLGVSAYSRAVGLIREADRIYSSLLWEAESKETAVFLSETMLEKDQAGNAKLPVGGERLFRVLDTVGGIVDKPFYEVFSPEIREGPLSDMLNGQLRRIEFTCGLAYGTLSDMRTVEKTATEIKVSKQRSLQTTKAIQVALASAMLDLAAACLFWSDVYGLGAGPYEMVFDFDDSVLDDSAAEDTIRLQEVAAGILAPEVYLMKRYRVTREEAAAMMPAAGPSIDGLFNA
jgi:A118 family predicted phage portal protein